MVPAAMLVTLPLTPNTEFLYAKATHSTCGGRSELLNLLCITHSALAMRVIENKLQWI